MGELLLFNKQAVYVIEVPFLTSLPLISESKAFVVGVPVRLISTVVYTYGIDIICIIDVRGAVDKRLSLVKG